MARRVPGARALMEKAAIELYAAGGDSEPTAAEIAARAGVTERTFFRHFPDKLDVLFGDEMRIREGLSAALRQAPEQPAPLLTVIGGLRDLACGFSAARDALRRRGAIIAAHPQLRAREFGRTFGWVEVIVDALAHRGTDEAAARDAALVGLAAFRAAYERWVEGSGDERLEDCLDATVARLSADLAHTSPGFAAP